VRRLGSERYGDLMLAAMVDMLIKRGANPDAVLARDTKRP
jgi:chemotaxis receptor (MCP) glutamine deamidase CheD